MIKIIETTEKNLKVNEIPFNFKSVKSIKRQLS